MGKIRTLWDDYLRRRNKPLMAQPRPQTPLADHDKRLWFPCLADSASVGDAPPYAAIKITGTELDADGRPYLTFKKPDANSLTGCPLLGHRGAVSNAFGRCTFEPWWAAYDDTDDPAFDENWGTVNGEWALKKGNSGFKILGGAADGRVLVKPAVEGMRMDWAQLTQAGTQTTSSGTLSPIVYTGGSTAASAAGVLSLDIAAGKINVAEDGFIIVLAQCVVQPDTLSANIDQWRFAVAHNTDSFANERYFPVNMNELDYNTLTVFHALSLPNGASAPRYIYTYLDNIDSSRNVDVAWAQLSVIWFPFPD